MKSRIVESYDGLKIAYRVYGQGEPTVILSNGIGCHQVFLDYIIEDLSKHFRVIIWDYRGHMDSEAPEDPRLWTLDCCMEDILAVMEDSKTECAAFAGFSMGVQINFEFASRFPEKVRALVAICGAYEYPLKTFFYIGPVFNVVFSSLLAFLRQYPLATQKLWKFFLGGPWAFPVASWTMVNRKKIKRSDFDLFRPHFANIDIILFLQMLAYLSENSALKMLDKIKVPTLVIAGAKDNFTPLKVNTKMHERIPGAELFVLPEGTHGALVEFPQIINSRVIQFLRERVAR